jgi:hypothetical protein
MCQFLLGFESGEPSGQGFVDERLGVADEREPCRRKGLIRRRDDRRSDFVRIAGKHGEAGCRRHAAKLPGGGRFKHIQYLPHIRARRGKIRARCASLDQRHLDTEQGNSPTQ